MSDLTKEEKQAYARRNESFDDMVAWRKMETLINVRRGKESNNAPSRIPAFEQKSFTQEEQDERVRRAHQPWRPNGLRWAPHKRTMIPEDEWNEDEYQDWRARHYLECFEKVQRLKEKVEAGQLPVIL